jgi:hypothetical protein
MKLWAFCSSIMRESLPGAAPRVLKISDAHGRLCAKILTSRMTTKSDYPQAEWETLQLAPFWVHDFVAPAHEMRIEAEDERLRTEVESGAYPDLAKEVFGSVAADFEGALTRLGQEPRPPDQGLVEVADILDARSTPDEAQGFKQAVLQIGASIAAASSGTAIEEESALTACATYLRYVHPGVDPAAGQTLRAKFSPDQWALIELAPFWVMFQVAGADADVHPLEAEFIQRSLETAAAQEDALLREAMTSAASDLPGFQARLAANPPSLAGVALVAGLVSTVLAPEEAASFKKALLGLASGTSIIDMQQPPEEQKILEALGVLLDV